MTMDDCVFIENEVFRINPETAQSNQSSGVQTEMKQWAIENNMWPHSVYQNIVDAHAVARGWTQEGFTGMEVWG